MDDPIQRHPTRDEQLDILVSVLADIVPNGGRVLDLGCGTGYVDWMLLQRRGDLHLTGLDLKPESLAEAERALAEWSGQVTLLPSPLPAMASMRPSPRWSSTTWTIPQSKPAFARPRRG